MRSFRSRFALVLVAPVAWALTACSSAPIGTDDLGPADQLQDAAARPDADLIVDAGGDLAGDADLGTPADLPDGGCASKGATRCEGRAVSTCAATGDALGWGPPVDCDPGQVCREDRCQAPTPDQRLQLDAVADFVANMAARTGWIDDFALDLAAITSAAQALILDGDGGLGPFYAALRRALLGFPAGHAALYSATECGTPELPYQDTSRLGVCARPSGDALVVTHVRPGNPLGLAPGDLVLDADGVRGPALLQQSLERPVCGTSSAADSHRRTTAATSFFATVPEGTVLRVQPGGGGTERSVVVPAGDQALLDCRDPLGRDTAFNARAELRQDGIAVIRLPRFFPLEGRLTDPPDVLTQQMQQAVQDAFDTVKDAPGLVWDLRANIGGITRVGLEIIAGMPGARALTLAHCQSRIPFSEPVAFYAGSEFAYSVTPGGPFAYTGRVAVVIDGLAISAADYFARALQLGTDVPLVGSAPAGAYGGGAVEFEASSDPSLVGVADPARCDDGTGVPLEGQAAVPDLEVEPTPSDLAAGIDTALEAAVVLVRD